MKNSESGFLAIGLGNQYTNNSPSIKTNRLSQLFVTIRDREVNLPPVIPIFFRLFVHRRGFSKLVHSRNFLQNSQHRRTEQIPDPCIEVQSQTTASKLDANKAGFVSLTMVVTINCNALVCVVNFETA